MFDTARFDEWVKVHANDDEAFELTKVAHECTAIVESMFGADVALKLARGIVEAGLAGPFTTGEAPETEEHLGLGDGLSAVEVMSDEIDLLNFDFGWKANAIKCYAMTGMLEDEQPDQSFEDKRHALQQLVFWGEMITDMVPETRHELPKFRAIVQAAAARLAIDLEHPVDVQSFAHLAAMFREGTAEQTRKTIQNQISAKQLAVNDSRRLLPESALQFLKGVSSFPSIWMLSEVDDNDGPLTNPVFIPVCVLASGDRPFLPCEKHPDGFRVGSGANAKVVEEYWDALQALSAEAEPAFQPLGSHDSVRCRVAWTRVDRSQIEAEMAAAKTATASLTDQVHRRLTSNFGARIHPAGHTDKMFRYVLPSGTEIAVEKRVGEPWLYARTDALAATPDVPSKIVTDTKHGRNSNLNALPTFKTQPLTKFRVKSVSEADAVMLALI